jgi:hypothetical protein
MPKAKTKSSKTKSSKTKKRNYNSPDKYWQNDIGDEMITKPIKTTLKKDKQGKWISRKRAAKRIYSRRACRCQLKGGKNNKYPKFCFLCLDHNEKPRDKINHFRLLHDIELLEVRDGTYEFKYRDKVYSLTWRELDFSHDSEKPVDKFEELAFHPDDVIYCLHHEREEVILYYKQDYLDRDHSKRSEVCTKNGNVAKKFTWKGEPIQDKSKKISKRKNNIQKSSPKK